MKGQNEVYSRFIPTNLGSWSMGLTNITEQSVIGSSFSKDRPLNIRYHCML